MYNMFTGKSMKTKYFFCRLSFFLKKLISVFVTDFDALSMFRAFTTASSRPLLSQRHLLKRKFYSALKLFTGFAIAALTA
jgi:hypothetical protein